MQGEVLIAVLGIAGTIIGALAFWLRSQSEAKLKETEAELLHAKAQLAQTESSAASTTQIMRMFEQQVAINQQFSLTLQQQGQTFVQSLQEKEKRDEGNYQVLKQIIDTHAGAISGLIADNTLRLERRLDGLPGQINVLAIEAIKTLGKEIGAELGRALSAQITTAKLDEGLFPFPEPSDPAWQEVFVQPTGNDAVLRRTPMYGDKYLIDHPFGAIKAEGQKVRIIAGRIRGWSAVMKRENGDPPAWGWLPYHAVKVVEAQPT